MNNLGREQMKHRSACHFRDRATVRLTVYLRGPARELSGIYDRMGAALRLKFARRLPEFFGYCVEPT